MLRAGLVSFASFRELWKSHTNIRFKLLLAAHPIAYGAYVPHVCIIFGSSVNLCGTLDHSRRLPRMLMYPSEGSGRLVYRQS
jgi:hypothetical protein